MLENIRLSVQGIWSHKMRSFLTMLGIIIGIAAIIAIVSTIKGTNEQIKQNIIGAGNNTVEIQLYEQDWVYEINDGTGIPDGIPVVSKATYEAIKGVDGVVAASVYNMRKDYGESVFYGSKVLSSGKITGIDQNYFQTCGYQIQDGRLFTTSDYKQFRKVVIIDTVIKRSLFEEEDPIGKTIEIKGEPFVVIGVAQKSEKFEPVINSMDDYYNFYQDQTGVLFIPSTVWPVIYFFDEPQNVVIRATSTEEMGTAGKQVAELLNGTSQSTSYKYKAQDLLEQAKQLQELSSSTNQQLIWIASISLLVGGIGVMNIMLVSVTERTREIGLKKAIGAKKGRILVQFLTESAVLTSLGGLIGVGAGIGLAQGISKLSETPVAISIPSIVISVVFSMVIGIVFGLLPSIKAANLNPIEALRYE